MLIWSCNLQLVKFNLINWPFSQNVGQFTYKVYLILLSKVSISNTHQIYKLVLQRWSYLIVPLYYINGFIVINAVITVLLCPEKKSFVHAAFFFSNNNNKNHFLLAPAHIHIVQNDVRICYTNFSCEFKFICNENGSFIFLCATESYLGNQSFSHWNNWSLNNLSIFVWMKPLLWKFVKWG